MVIDLGLRSAMRFFYDYGYCYGQYVERTHPLPLDGSKIQFSYFRAHFCPPWLPFTFLALTYRSDQTGHRKKTKPKPVF